ncbi:unnamed protein product [Cuscuta campestris]|uniref:PDZ domain-containing protein n=1 Tax=Cuscuta campestris TaxID=132261 RepID=A0A484N1S2_9ASTE|nr:unnamed protein product [Cuscuta campestris]
MEQSLELLDGAIDQAQSIWASDFKISLQSLTFTAAPYLRAQANLFALWKCSDPPQYWQLGMERRGLKRTLTDLPAPRFNPWKRAEPLSLPWDTRDERRDHFGRFDQYVQANQGLDFVTKSAALQASSCVVSLISFSGPNHLFTCSGIVIKCDNVDDGFCYTILTSASLLRGSSHKSVLPDDLKVDVYLSNRSLCRAEVESYDFHYNVCSLSFKSTACLQIAVIGNIDGSSMAPMRTHSSRSFQLVPHRETAVDLSSQMDVIALGRYHDPPYHIMAAPGVLRLEDSGLDCEDLLMTSCRITKNGIGGPVISYSGCVIGISYYKSVFTPFLPINIALRCLEHLRTSSKVPRPWLGLKLSDLHTLRLGELEKINQTFPQLVEGVVVTEVEPESPASHAGLCRGDVIVQLDRMPVTRTLKFKGLVLDKANGPLEVIVKRVGCETPLTLTLSPQRPKRRNRWPIPKEWFVIRPWR